MYKRQAAAATGRVAILEGGSIPPGETGLVPVVHSFACFLSARPNEQIYNNASEGTKVIYVGSLAGLLPGGPGHSHQAVRDISVLATVPNLLLVEPCAEVEVAAILDFCLHETEASSYIRLVSLGWSLPFTLPSDYTLRVGIGIEVRQGSDIVIFGAGPWLLANAYHAAEKLDREQGVTARVVNLPWLNRVDSDWLRETVAGARRVVTLDTHNVDGGQGQMLAFNIARLGLAIPVTSLGVRELSLIHI